MELETIFKEYERKAEQVRQRARPTDGLFGMGRDPKSDSCHMDFFDAVGAWVKDLRREAPGAARCMEAVEYLILAPSRCKNQDCYWMMYAAMGWARELVPCLTPGDCGKARDLMDGLYPPKDRFPAQKKLYKALFKGARM